MYFRIRYRGHSIPFIAIPPDRVSKDRIYDDNGDIENCDDIDEPGDSGADWTLMLKLDFLFS